MHCRTFFLERFPFLWFLSSPFYITVSSRISFLVFQVFKLFSQLYGSNWQSIQSPDIVPLLAFFFFHFVTLIAQWCLIDCLYDRGNNRTSTAKALCFYSFIKKKKRKFLITERVRNFLINVPQIGNVFCMFCLSCVKALSELKNKGLNYYRYYSTTGMSMRHLQL